jgi:hypothetical protein
MACSFCCAPLLAVRDFAQPPQGAELIRIIVGLVALPGSFRIDDEANLNEISRRPLLKVAIGDEGVKSVKLPAKLRANAAKQLRKTQLWKHAPRRFFSLI